MDKNNPNNIETEIADDSVIEMSPIVSVMMLTYNHGHYLAQALESVVNQETNFQFEIIIGEDGSTDDTRQIALDFQQRYPHLIRLVYSEKNVGPFPNGDRCFQRARGEFFAWCEGDDYWSDTQKLQQQVDNLRSHPECVLIHSDYDYLVYNFGKWRAIKSEFRPKRRDVTHTDNYEALLSEMFIRTCTMMVRTAPLLEHIKSPLRTADHPAGDRGIVLHLCHLGQIHYSPQSTAVYRRAPGSMVNSGYGALVKMQKKMLTMYGNFDVYFPIDSVLKQKLHLRHYQNLMRFAMRAGQKEDVAQAMDGMVSLGQGFGDWKKNMISISVAFPAIYKVTGLFRNLIREIDLYLRSKRSS